jgi:hypothetical protein
MFMPPPALELAPPMLSLPAMLPPEPALFPTLPLTPVLSPADPATPLLPLALTAFPAAPAWLVIPALPALPLAPFSGRVGFVFGAEQAAIDRTKQTKVRARMSASNVDWVSVRSALAM